MVYFTELIWENIMEYVGDLKMEKQRERKLKMVNQIKYIGYDYLNFEFLFNNVQHIYYMEWNNFYMDEGIESDSEDEYYSMREIVVIA